VAGKMNGVAAYGHWGRPVLAFPIERGDAGEFERQGMVAALGGLLIHGRVKLYCVDSFDHESWSNHDIPHEERARRHGLYEAWILDQVVQFVRHDCGGASEPIACGAVVARPARPAPATLLLRR
jgi:esterase/lipase superfamily enzyme